MPPVLTILTRVSVFLLAVGALGGVDAGDVGAVRRASCLSTKMGARVSC